MAPGATAGAAAVVSVELGCNLVPEKPQRQASGGDARGAPGSGTSGGEHVVMAYTSSAEQAAKAAEAGSGAEDDANLGPGTVIGVAAASDFETSIDLSAMASTAVTRKLLPG